MGLTGELWGMKSGHGQKSKRPALVASNRVFNNVTNLALVCPINNSKRRFPLNVALGDSLTTTGYVMCETLAGCIGFIVARPAAG